MNLKKNIPLWTLLVSCWLGGLNVLLLTARPTGPEDHGQPFSMSPLSSSPLLCLSPAQSSTNSLDSSPLSTSPKGSESPFTSLSSSPSGSPLSTSPKGSIRHYNPQGHFTLEQAAQRNQANDQHKRNLGAAMILVVPNPEDTEDPYLCLIQRGKNPYGIALPGGGIENKETALEAAIREASEEVGYTIDHPENIREIYNTTDPKQHPTRLAAQFMYAYQTPEDYATMQNILRANDDARAVYLVKLSELREVLVDHTKNIWEIIDESPDWTHRTNTQFALLHDLALKAFIQSHEEALQQKNDQLQQKDRIAALLEKNQKLRHLCLALKKKLEAHQRTQESPAVRNELSKSQQETLENLETTACVSTALAPYFAY